MIDNTNVQKFEIFPYIQLANRYRYSSCHTSLHKVHPVLVLETPTPCVCVCMCICMCICICSGIQCLCLRPQPRGQRTRRSWLGETRMESPRRSLPRGSGNGNHCHHCKVQQRNLSLCDGLLLRYYGWFLHLTDSQLLLKSALSFLTNVLPSVQVHFL